MGDMYIARKKDGTTYALSEFWRTLPQSLLRNEKEIENIQRAASFISCSNSQDNAAPGITVEGPMPGPTTHVPGSAPHVQCQPGNSARESAVRP